MREQLYNKGEVNEIEQRAQRLAGEIVDLSGSAPNATIPTVFETNSSAELPLRRAPAGYNLNKEIEKIKTLSSQNLKPCLFVGRTSEESLPAPAPGEVWVSLDYAYDRRGALCNDNFTSNTPRLADRIHLVIDFNDKREINRIRDMFDKVVVDVGVLHWIEGDAPYRWILLATLLKNNLEAQLTTNTLPVTCAGKKEEVTKNDFEKARELFARGVYTKEGIYPYETKLKEKINFFVFTGPRKELINQRFSTPLGR